MSRFNSNLPCLETLLRAQSENAPAALTLLAPERTALSYNDLYAQIEYSKRALNAFGIGRGDRVAIVLPNGPEMATAFLCVAACATAAPLNPAYRADEFDFYLSDLSARALIVPQNSDSVAIEIAKKRGISILELAFSPAEAAGIFTIQSENNRHESSTRNAEFNAETAQNAEKFAFAEADDIALVLHTSGTTSRPKIVPLTQRNLVASASNIARALELSPADRSLNIMPLFHIHGLIASTLSSLFAGASVVCTPGFYAPSFFDWLNEFRPSWYSAVPTMHASIVARAPQNAEIIARNPLRFVRSSSSALAPQLKRELENAFGAPAIEAYGMTEAAHQMASNPLPPRARKAGSVGIAAGPEIAILDDANRVLDAHQIGEICIRGENVTPGYENNAAANQSAFTAGWFRTGDQGFLDDENYLVISGRLKEIINRGGEKISPREIDEILLQHPAVAQAVAFAIPHQTLGEEIGAVLVLRDNFSVSQREIREFAASRLADFKVPSRVVFIEEIPKGATGKLQRIGLAEKLNLTSENAETPPENAEFVAPRTPQEEELAQIWCRVLKVERAGIDDNFFACGGDSMMAAQFLARVLEARQVRLSMFSFFENPTLRSVSSQLENDEETAQNVNSNDAEIERILAEMTMLSDDEAQKILAKIKTSSP